MFNIPTIHTAPNAPFLPFSDLKEHLRLDTDEDESLVMAYQAAAYSYLDGYHGRLGRATLPQKWQIEFYAQGTEYLPMPDVVSVEVFDVGGQPYTDYTLHKRGAETTIEFTGSIELVNVIFECAMHQKDLPTIAAYIRSMVAHQFYKRDGDFTQVVPSYVLDRAGWHVLCRTS